MNLFLVMSKGTLDSSTAPSVYGCYVLVYCVAYKQMYQLRLVCMGEEITFRKYKILIILKYHILIIANAWVIMHVF